MMSWSSRYRWRRGLGPGPRRSAAGPPRRAPKCGRWTQRIHRRIDALLHDLPGQHGGGVQMGEGGGGAGSVRSSAGTYTACTEVMAPLRVEVIRSLKRAHLVGQGGLIAHGGGHPPHQSGHLRACLDIAEDLVDEEQHILVLPVPEVLRHGQPGEGHPHPGPGGSFIWPKTRAVLFRTPESLISRQRSLPSRVRSPTPVKME